VLYAIVVPVLKITAIIASEYLLRGSDEQVQWARRCVRTVQVISKWASPDMFAYILLVYLIRGLDKPPMLSGLADLRVGFTCFAIFCVFSTIASLGIKPPPLQGREGDQRVQDSREIVSGQSGSARGYKEELQLFVLTSFLFSLFIVCIGVGVCLPCMALRLDVDSLYEPDGPIDPILKPIINNMHLPEMTAADVNIWSCIKQMAIWAAQGEAVSCIAFLLFTIFVILFSTLDMAVLLFLTIQQYMYAGSGGSSSRSSTRLLLNVSTALNKLSMLDVSIVGVVIVVLSGSVYRKNGVILSMRLGLLVLFVAEACHYAAYFMVTRSIHGGAQKSSPVDSKAREIELESGMGELKAGKTIRI